MKGLRYMKRYRDQKERVIFRPTYKSAKKQAKNKKNVNFDC